MEHERGAESNQGKASSLRPAQQDDRRDIGPLARLDQSGNERHSSLVQVGSPDRYRLGSQPWRIGHNFRERQTGVKPQWLRFPLTPTISVT